MSHEHRVPKSNRLEPGGSTSECLTLLPKDTYPNPDCQEPVVSTSNRLTLVPNKIRHVCTHNKIAEPSINNKY